MLLHLRPGGDHFRRSLRFELLEILDKQRGKLTRLPVVGVLVGPRVTRIQDFARHAGTCHRYRQPEDRIEFGRHFVELAVERGRTIADFRSSRSERVSVSNSISRSLNGSRLNCEAISAYVMAHLPRYKYTPNRKEVFTQRTRLSQSR